MNLKVLVVDDTILFRRLLSEAISAIDGAEVVGTAANGRVALTRMHELKPDLVTLDIEMPGMDGLQVLDEMKSDGTYDMIIERYMPYICSWVKCTP